MKGFDLLPRAEKISADSLDNNEAVKEKRFGINVNIWVFIALFLILVVSMFMLPNLFFIMFGAIFILASFNKSGTIKSNHRKVKNTMWNRMPFLLAGIFVEMLGIAFIIANKKDEEQSSRAFGIMFPAFIGILVLLMIGRLIFLIACACAISKRKKECTECVFAELDGFTGNADIMNDNIDLSDPEIGFAYRYYYNGDYHRFVVSEAKDDIIFDDGNLEVYIDPDQSERYYSKQLFSYNAEKLKSYLKKLAYLIAIIALIWGFTHAADIIDLFI